MLKHLSFHGGNYISKSRRANKKLSTTDLAMVYCTFNFVFVFHFNSITRPQAQTLMGNLSEYVTQWRRERDITLSRLDCAVGDSLLTAACATYHGVLGEKQRNQSLTLWKQACEMVL